MIEKDKRLEKIKKIEEDQLMKRKLSMRQRDRVQSLHRIHDISLMGETKKDRDYYIKFYKLMSIIYIVFLIFALSVLIIIDTIPWEVRSCINILDH